MSESSSQSNRFNRGMLATDLDGTLIPLNGNKQNKADLRTMTRALKNQSVALAFVTGRHIESVVSAIEEFSLPKPNWIICDVGSSIYQHNSIGTFELCHEYRVRLKEIAGFQMPESTIAKLDRIQGLRLQEQEKQSEFKLSFYTDGHVVNDKKREIANLLGTAEIPFKLIASVDPFNGDGLIDILPAGVSKAFALDWLVSFCSVSKDTVVFAGDSGNDYAAMTAGYQTIVVNNAEKALVQKVHDEHEKSGWTDRLYHARSNATSGVWEGCLRFNLLCNEDDSR